MRRALVLALVAVAVASAAAMAPGAAGPQAVQRAEARAPTIASLKHTFTALLPATACDAGATKRAAALKLRKGALKGVAKATPKQLKAKKAYRMAMAEDNAMATGGWHEAADFLEGFGG